MLKTYYCLKSEDVRRLKTCADPPSRKELAVILADVLVAKAPLFDEPHRTAIANTAGLIRRKKPSLEWMLLLMS